MHQKIMKATVQRKPWDSNFFGFPVGDLYALCSAQFLAQKLVEFRQEGYKLIYWKIDSEDDSAFKNAAELKLYLADTKVTYRLDLKNREPDLAPSSGIKKYTGSITSQLIDLGLQSGVYSRFKTDKNFAPGTFEKMYGEWINNSFSAEMADAIFIAEENNTMIGFTTIFENAENVEIVLIAVAEQYRRKGYGKKLVEFVASYAKNNNADYVYVVTQAQNKPACALYESYGFELIKKELIYHIWL